MPHSDDVRFSPQSGKRGKNSQQPGTSEALQVMSPRKIGPFEIHSQLGVGGMGIVYLATYTPNGKKVALKVLTPALLGDERLLKRFEREITILKRLDHPNIVRYYGGGTESRQRYYAMEYIDGGSLLDVLKRKKRLNWQQGIHVGRQLCSALEHAHNAGIIHRDLKPANLFVTRKGRLKLGDFGIARDTEATALTAVGKTVGTYAYMAPEQIHGNYPITRKTDLYATGCLLYELLTGQTPFEAENPAEMLVQHLNDEPPTVSELRADCPPALNQLIEELIEKNPEERPYDALAVHTRLGEIRDSLANGTASPAQGSGGDPKADDEVSRNSNAAIKEVRRRKKKKKKAREAQPFWEQTWFLVTSLLILIGLTLWMMQPPGEQELYFDAREAMTKGDEFAQREALTSYIQPYLDDFPEGEFSEEMKAWRLDVLVDILAAQTEKRAAGIGDLRSPAEREYVAILKQQEDPARSRCSILADYYAWGQKLHDSPDFLQSDEEKDVAEAAVWKRLLEDKIQQLRTEVLKADNCRERLAAFCRTAEEALASGEDKRAQLTFTILEAVFDNEPQTEDFADYGRRRLRGEELPIPGTEPPAATEDTPSDGQQDTSTETSDAA